MSRAERTMLEVERKVIIAAGVPESRRDRLDFILRTLDAEQRRIDRARLEALS